MQKERLKGEGATATVLFARHDVTMSQRHDVTTLRRPTEPRRNYRETASRLEGLF